MYKPLSISYSFTIKPLYSFGINCPAGSKNEGENLEKY
jgi:hypothetical protein